MCSFHVVLLPLSSPSPEFCDDDDEVLLLLSSTLGDLIDAVGGSEYAAVLLVPLEQLAGTEESAVRNQSVAAMQKIAAQLSDAHLAEFMLPLLRRLTTAEWFTSRISSAGLYASIYPRVNDHQKRELRALFLQLCNTDETPMVKRAATAHFGEFCSVMDSATVNQEFLPVLQKLAKDEQDSVKLLTVSACIAIAKIFGKDNKALNVRRMDERTS
jgi:serine/threonine-protein phosphatase 2A regulatory subunit A